MKNAWESPCRGASTKFRPFGDYDYELKQAKHMKETFREIFHNMGAIITHGNEDSESTQWGLNNPGNVIHEGGTVRMGSSSKSSPLNKWSQAYDCKNLFCVDGSPFTSQADKNITWTILALSMRASDHIVARWFKMVRHAMPEDI